MTCQTHRRPRSPGRPQPAKTLSGRSAGSSLTSPRSVLRHRVGRIGVSPPSCQFLLNPDFPAYGSGLLASPVCRARPPPSESSSGATSTDTAAGRPPTFPSYRSRPPQCWPSTAARCPSSSDRSAGRAMPGRCPPHIGTTPEGLPSLHRQHISMSVCTAAIVAVLAPRNLNCGRGSNCSCLKAVCCPSDRRPAGLVNRFGLTTSATEGVDHS